MASRRPVFWQSISVPFAPAECHDKRQGNRENRPGTAASSLGSSLFLGLRVLVEENDRYKVLPNGHLMPRIALVLDEIADGDVRPTQRGGIVFDP